MATNNEEPVPNAVTTLRDDLGKLVDEAQALREDVQRAEKRAARDAEDRRRATIVGVGALVLVTLALVLMAVFMVILFGAVRQIDSVATRNAALNERIADCSTAGGKCYEEGAKRTGQAIQQLIDSQLYIIECSRELPIAENPPGPAFDAKFEKCVADRLARPGTK